ncbi:MAG: hypothetical protein GQ564_10980 [Bacteroidales bacterium]|nr:hypothetical protein [Bacteroidales bacterium]
MKIKAKISLAIVIALSLIVISCEKDDDGGNCSGPESLFDITIKYYPDEGTSSVKYFNMTYNSDLSFSGVNNETQYFGNRWQYDDCKTIITTYPDGGKETITLTSETRYSYTGVTSTGYYESHVGTWDWDEPIVIEHSSFTDSRDNKTYNTIIVGDQEWMAENFRFEPENINYYKYIDEQNNAPYGCYYERIDAVNCAPDGWHLPSNNEWNELLGNLVDDYYVRYESMIEQGIISIDNDIKTALTNKSGFNALSSGAYYIPKDEEALRGGEAGFLCLGELICFVDVREDYYYLTYPGINIALAAPVRFIKD